MICCQVNSLTEIGARIVTQKHNEKMLHYICNRTHGYSLCGRYRRKINEAVKRKHHLNYYDHFHYEITISLLLFIMIQ